MSDVAEVRHGIDTGEFTQKIHAHVFVPEKDGLEFTCDTSVLVEALGLISKAIPGRVVMPVHGYVLLGADKGDSLWLRSGGTELQVRVQVSSLDITRPGALTLPGKFLHEVIMSMNSGPMSFKSDDVLARASIKDDKGSERTIIGLPTSQFVQWPPIRGSKLIETDAEFLDAVKRAVVSTAKESQGPRLGSVYVATAGNTMVIASTDGNRLSESILRFGDKDLPRLSAMIRASMINQLVTMCDGVGMADDKLQIDFTDNMFHAVITGDKSIARADIYCSLSAEPFVDYERVIPKAYTAIYRIDKSELLQALKTTRIYGRDDNGRCVLLMRPSTLSIYSRDRFVGRSIIDIEREVIEGENPEHMNIDIDAEKLIDGIKTIPTAKVEIGITKPQSPVMLRPDDPDIEYVHIIMPMNALALPQDMEEYNASSKVLEREEINDGGDISV